MAMTNSGNSAGRRWVFGANVAVMTALAVFLLVGVNLLGQLKNNRWDLTGGISGHRVSERTKHVLTKAGKEQPIRITTVYASDNPESARKEYFPRVQDLCEELKQYGRTVGIPIEVEHIVGGNDQAKLRDRIQQTFGSVAGEYSSLVALAQTAWKDMADNMADVRQQVVGLVSGDSWVGNFSTLANIAAILQRDLKNIEDTKQEVESLVHGEGIPRYSEANEKIKKLDDELKQHLDQVQNWTKEVDKLAKVLADPNSDFAKTTRARLAEIKTKVASLRQTVGDPNAPEVPEDPKPVLQEFAKAALQLGDLVTGEASRVTTFTNEHPALRQHPRWQMKSGIFVVDQSALLTSAAESLTQNGQALRSYLQQNVPLDQLQNLVRQTRQLAVELGQTLEQWDKNVSAVLDEGATIDANTKSFLADAAAGKLFSKTTERITELTEKISKLPELKLDEVASRLQQDNIIVVERGQDVRAVTFDEAWPYADPSGRSSARNEEGVPVRVFDGDSAISDVLMAMTSAKPSATVVFVTYEEEVPPQMRQMQRPMTGPMPLQAIRTMQEQLKKMQFKVETWNIAEEKARENKPKGEEGVPTVYVFLPPPGQMPPFMMRQPQKQFSRQDAEIAREVLAEGGLGIFLANWEQSPPMMGPPPEYGWNPILTEDWGINVDSARRVIRGVVDRKKPGLYAIDVVQWWYMQLSHFTDQPIGAPLKARRMLMKDVCPVLRAETVPADVKIEEILSVPAGTTDTWAEKDIQRIFEALQTGARDSSFTRGEDATDPPFTVVLAAEKTIPAKAAASEPAASQPASAPASKTSRIIVMGNGLSLRDDYLMQRVIRFGGKGTRLATDPPPTENMDLLVNGLYWLTGHTDLIAAGPAEVPVVAAVDPNSRMPLWFVVIGWSGIALVVGVVMWVVRRK